MELHNVTQRLAVTGKTPAVCTHLETTGPYLSNSSIRNRHSVSRRYFTLALKRFVAYVDFNFTCYFFQLCNYGRLKLYSCSLNKVRLEALHKTEILVVFLIQFSSLICFKYIIQQRRVCTLKTKYAKVEKMSDRFKVSMWCNI